MANHTTASLWLAFVVASSLIMTGCGGSSRQVIPGSVALYEQGDYAAALNNQVQWTNPQDPGHPTRNAPLEQMRLGLLTMANGEMAAAAAPLNDAILRINDFSNNEGEDEALSKFGFESDKLFRGYPYERMYVLTYYGMTQLAERGYAATENALAAFQNSIKEDYAGELLTEMEEERLWRLGMALEPDPEESNYFRVTALDPGWAAEQAGVQVGDLIRRIDGSKTRKYTPYELTEHIQEIEGPVELQIVRNGHDDYLELFIDRGTNPAVDRDQFTADTALNHYLSGICQLHLGDDEDAAFSLGQAQLQQKKLTELGYPELHSDWFQPSIVKNQNLVVIAGVGFGPIKVREGEFGEIAKIIPNPRGGSATARVTVNGERIGTTMVFDDIIRQATTRGPSEMDEVLEGKARFKHRTAETSDTLLNTGVSLMIAGSLSDSRELAGAGAITAGIGFIFGGISSSATPEADIRHLEMLPATMQAIATELPPGPATVRIEFVDAQDNVISSHPDWIYNVEIPAAGSGPVVLYAHDGRNEPQSLMEADTAAELITQ